MKSLRYIFPLFLFLSFEAAYTQTSLHPFNNGLTLLVSKSSESGLVGLSLLVYGGTQYETDGQYGTFRLVIDMLLRGTQNSSADDISFRISQLGDSVDTYITGDYWAIEATVEPDEMEQLLELLYDLIRHPLFLDEELDKAKRIAVQTIRTEEDSPLHMGIDFYRTVFYPDFHTSPEKMIRNIECIERDELLSIFSRFFNPGNMVLALSGNLNRDEVVRHITASFGSDPCLEPALVREIKRQQPQSLPVLQERRGGITQAGIIMGTRLEGFKRKDALLIEVANAVLDNSLGGRLFEEVRKKGGLVYSISPYYSLRIQPYTWFILAATRKRNYYRVIRIMKGVLQHLIEAPPTEEEVKLAKNFVSTRLAISYQSPLRRAHYEAERLIRGEPILNLEERSLAIEDVKREEILSFINRYAAGDWTTLVVR